MELIKNLDNAIILSIHSFMSKSPFLVNIFDFITTLGDRGFIWIVFAVLMLFKRHTRGYGLILLLSLFVGSYIGNHFLKNLIKRVRPFYTLGLVPFIAPPGGYSFPSGHSLSAFVGGYCIFKCNKRLGYFALFLSFLIAISRLLLIVHYLTDILAGAIIGILTASAFLYLAKKLKITN